LRQRRRDDTGKLSKHEQRDQCADKVRYRPELLHQCFARDRGRLRRRQVCGCRGRSSIPTQNISYRSMTNCP
jgi:hypothetical protein